MMRQASNVPPGPAGSTTASRASEGRHLVTAFAATTTVSIVSLALVHPPCPSGRLPVEHQPVVGVAVGMFLVVLITMHRPAFGTAIANLRRCRTWLLAMLACNEEIVFRRLVVGELLPWGMAAAISGATILFAVAHREHSGVHLVTGAVFCTTYLATGGILCVAVAHWVYNALTDARMVLTERQRAQGSLA